MMNPYTEKKKKCEKENSSFLFLKCDNVFLYEWVKCVFILLLTTLVVTVVTI